MYFRGLKRHLALTSGFWEAFTLDQKQTSNTVAMVACPQCKKNQIYSTQNPSRPFCSERCKTMDTAAWATDEYVIPEKVAGVDQGLGSESDEYSEY